MLAPVAPEEGPADTQTEDEHIVELAAAAAHGNDAAFVELYSLFSQRVFNLVLRSVHDRGLAEDLCQEIWLKVHHEIRSLRAPEAIRSWLYRIASRACIDFARSSRAARSSGEELLEEVAQAYDPMPEDAAIQGSQVRMVWETLATMAPRQSIALYLKQVDGRSYAEISSILNCNRETVESLLFRARQSFVRAYDRVQSSPVQRCSMFQQVVADVVDNEPTQLQKGAIHAHMQECRSCRTQLPDMAAAAKGYGMLPLLPLTKGIVLQTILGGAAVGTAVVTPAATGGVIAGLSLKAKLVALFGLLAAGATGATTTQVINLPIVPDIGAVFRDGPSQDENNLLVSGQGDNGAAAQLGLTNPPGGAAGASGSTNANGPSAAGRRNTSGSGTNPGDSAGSGSGGQQPPAPPAAPTSGSPASGSGDAGSGGAGGLLPPGATPPLGALLQDPVGTLGGVVDGTLGALDGTLEELDGVVDDTVGLVDDTLGGLGETVDDVIEPLDPLLDEILPGEELDDVVDDTLDTLLPPPDGDGGGPVEDIIDDVDDTLDDILPGDGEEDDGGLLGDILDPILAPGETTPPAGTPEPEATEPPGCVLIILC